MRTILPILLLSALASAHAEAIEEVEEPEPEPPDINHQNRQNALFIPAFQGYGLTCPICKERGPGRYCRKKGHHARRR